MQLRSRLATCADAGLDLWLHIKQCKDSITVNAASAIFGRGQEFAWRLEVAAAMKTLKILAQHVYSIRSRCRGQFAFSSLSPPSGFSEVHDLVLFVVFQIASLPSSVPNTAVPFPKESKFLCGEFQLIVNFVSLAEFTAKVARALDLFHARMFPGSELAAFCIFLQVHSTFLFSPLSLHEDQPIDLKIRVRSTTFFR